VSGELKMLTEGGMIDVEKARCISCGIMFEKRNPFNRIKLKAEVVSSLEDLSCELVMSDKLRRAYERRLAEDPNDKCNYCISWARHCLEGSTY